MMLLMVALTWCIIRTVEGAMEKGGNRNCKKSETSLQGRVVRHSEEIKVKHLDVDKERRSVRMGEGEEACNTT